MKKEKFNIIFTSILTFITNLIYILKLSNISVIRSIFVSIMMMVTYYIIINLAFAISEEFLK